MGTIQSTCCGASGKENGAGDFLTAEAAQRGADDATATFRQRLEKGIEVHLILQDEAKLKCQVRLDRSNDFILLSCDKKVRAIGMQDIKAILHTPSELQRVESSAGITNFDTCAAIHLTASGNCIPLFFLSAADKNMFVTVLNEARKAITTTALP